MSLFHERDNAQVVQQLRQGAEVRLQAMEAAVASSLQQQQQLYSSIQHMTSQFMQQKGADLAALQVRHAAALQQVIHLISPSFPLYQVACASLM